MAGLDAVDAVDDVELPGDQQQETNLQTLDGLRAYSAEYPTFVPFRCASRASSQSVVYLYVPVVVTNSADSSVYDPTQTPVPVSLCVQAGFDDPTWIGATWEVSEDNGITIYYACALIGPGEQINPGPGDWDVGVLLSDGAQTPVFWPGCIALD